MDDRMTDIRACHTTSERMVWQVWQTTQERGCPTTTSPNGGEVVVGRATPRSRGVGQ